LNEQYGHSRSQNGMCRYSEYWRPGSASGSRVISIGD